MHRPRLTAAQRSRSFPRLSKRSSQGDGAARGLRPRVCGGPAARETRAWTTASNSGLLLASARSCSAFRSSADMPMMSVPTSWKAVSQSCPVWSTASMARMYLRPDAGSGLMHIRDSVPGRSRHDVTAKAAAGVAEDTPVLDLGLC